MWLSPKARGLTQLITLSLYLMFFTQQLCVCKYPCAMTEFGQGHS